VRAPRVPSTACSAAGVWARTAEQGVRERTRQRKPSHDATASCIHLPSLRQLFRFSPRWLTCIHVGCIAGCALATVGSNTAGGSKAVAIGATHACPSTVSKANWYGSDTYADTFSVAQSGSTITVARADAPGASWEMNLQFYCCPGKCRILPSFALVVA
jgi:hypothetical protein